MEIRRIWLMHGDPDCTARCVSLPLAGRQVWLCARCSGTALGYLGAFALLLAWRPGPGPHDAWMLLGLMAPALIDWSWSRLSKMHRWNSVRIASGVLLGCALARVSQLLAFDPKSEAAWTMLLAGLGVGLVVSWVRSLGIDALFREGPRLNDDAEGED